MLDSSMKNGPTIFLAENAVHTVHLGGCIGLVATLLGLEVSRRHLSLSILLFEDGSELYLRFKGG